METTPAVVMMTYCDTRVNIFFLGGSNFSFRSRALYDEARENVHKTNKKKQQKSGASSKHIHQQPVLPHELLSGAV